MIVDLLRTPTRSASKQASSMGDDILSYNGGVAVAMKGKECVAIACDKRYGVQNRTIATNFTKIFQYSEHCFVSFCGLATDVSAA